VSQKGDGVPLATKTGWKGGDNTLVLEGGAIADLDGDQFVNAVFKNWSAEKGFHQYGVFDEGDLVELYSMEGDDDDDDVFASSNGAGAGGGGEVWVPIVFLFKGRGGRHEV